MELLVVFRRRQGNRGMPVDVRQPYDMQAAIRQLYRDLLRIERILVDDVARPIVYHGNAAQCRHPYVKGHVRQMNSIYNNWRLDNIWFDK